MRYENRAYKNTFERSETSITIISFLHFFVLPTSMTVDVRRCIAAFISHMAYGWLFGGEHPGTLLEKYGVVAYDV
jgi:hypothetical protein